MIRSVEDLLSDVEKEQSERSLLQFMTHGWHVLEPAMPFVPNYAVYAICDHLEAVSRGDIKRLLMNVPPGTTKSMTTCVFFPAWEWGPRNMPQLRFLTYSHEKGLSTRDSVRSRDLMQSEWYQGKWGDRFKWKTDQNAKEYYENTETGWRRSNSSEGLTGRRGDRVIGDDPHTVKGAESEAKRTSANETFSTTVPTRLNDPENSAIIIIMQRVHETDTSSLALELGYEHLMLPMEFESERRCYSIVPPSYIPNAKPVETKKHRKTKVWTPISVIEEDRIPEYDEEIQLRYNVDVRENDGDLLDPKRFTRKVVEDLKNAMRLTGGTYAEAGQLQQRPAPREGGMFQEGDFKYIDRIGDLRGVIVRGWDLAMSDKKKSPYSVGVKIMLTFDKRVIIMDVNRFKKTPGLMEDEFVATTKRDGKNVIVDIPQDPGQAGKSQVAAFAKLIHGYHLRSSLESGSKEQRASLLSAQAEHGNVYLVRAPWNDAFVNEAKLFPNSDFKDQIDAASRAYTSLIRGGRGSLALPPTVVTVKN